MRKREKHNHSLSLEYHAWRNMKARCLNPGYHGHHRYGGRGIRVCERWVDSFVAFLQDMGPMPPGHSLERKDNDGDYTPDNCVWIPKELQARNRHNTVHLTIGDRTMTVVEWADEAPEGITGDHIRMRLRKLGWTPERAVFTPRRWARRKRTQQKAETV